MTTSARILALDHLLAERAAGVPIRVGMVGAGTAGRAIALQLVASVSGIRLVAIANRTPANARRAFAEAGDPPVVEVSTGEQLDRAVARGQCVVTADATALITAQSLDVIVEVTGTVEYAANVVTTALEHGKHVVLVNAELDATVGPILARRAADHGVVLTNTDGDEPGVAMTLLRYLRSLGLRPVAAGNLKGLVDHYRTPETQRGFAQRYGLNPHKAASFADATKLSMEATILANATGFRVGTRGMYGPACADVREIATRLPADAMVTGGLVDYALDAAPYTGAFVIVHEPDVRKQRLLAYGKMGDGPFYVFYTPFHVPHLQLASTIARAVLLHDATVCPLDGPVCETIAVAKRDLRAGEQLDGVGGFCTYGLIDNAEAAAAADALPMGVAEDCRLLRDIPRDTALTYADVELPPNRLIDELRREQQAMLLTGVASRDP